MKQFFALTLILSSLLNLASFAQQSTELFPAKSGQWKQAGPGHFSIKDGVATSQGGMGLWWYSGKAYGNATFDIEVRLPDHQWNSGVFVRFPDPKNDPWIAVRQGYECQVSGDMATKHGTGAIYDLQAPSHITLKKAGEWNQYQITTFDDYIIIVVNGELVNVFTAQKGRGEKLGHIGLQNHDPVSKVDYKKITVREWQDQTLEEVLSKLGITRADWLNYHTKRNVMKWFRWAQKMDLGPAWANTFGDYYQGNKRVKVLKGLSLELSHTDSVRALYDTETMRLSSATPAGYEWGGTPWTGGHGSKVTSKNHKKSIMETSTIAGWASPSGSFEDTREHPGHGNFSKDHMRYLGHYRYGSQVILASSVLNTRVLETMTGEIKNRQAMVYRQLELAPAKVTRSMLVADSKGSKVEIARDGNSAIIRKKSKPKKAVAAATDKVTVVIDQTKGKWAELAMGAPSNRDDVDRSKNKATFFRVIPEFVPTHPRGGDEEGVAVRLNDGLVSRSDDDVDRVFFFADTNKTGRLEMNLGSVTPVSRIHLYSHHRQDRSGQDVQVFVSQKPDANSSLPYDQLEKNGWKKLASYTTKKIKNEGKFGAAIVAPKGKDLGHFQKILFLCKTPAGTKEHSFFTEIDLYKSKAPVLKPLAHQVGNHVFCVSKKGKYGKFRDAGDGRLVIDFPAATKSETATLAYASASAHKTKSAIELLQHSCPAPEQLERFTRGGPAAYPETITTKGTVSQEKAAWVADQVGIPTKNPWNAKIRPGGFDFFPDGDSAALSTWEGDVWIVTGLNGDFQEFKWRRYATGLFETLGLKIVNGVIYVHGRDQITRLHDQNHDGEADWYECFNNDVIITKNFHEFAFSLQTDKAGNFYITKGSPVLAGGRGFDKILPHNGTVMRISKDGKKLDVLATGLRAPGAVTVGPNGEITTGENEGSWQPCCKLNYFTGKDKFLGTEPSAQHLKGQKMHLPLCYFPMYIDNSGGGQVWVPNDAKWGLRSGELVHLSYGKSSLYRVLPQEVNGQMQGGVVRIPVQLKSSAMRARFHPQDRSVYVLGFRGWQTTAATEQAFERIRYTGESVTIPDQLKVTDKGIYIRFEKKLDKGWAEDRFNYQVERWKYIRSSQYGSGEFSIDKPDLNAEKRALKQEMHSHKKHDQVEVVNAKLLSDGKTVFLHIPSMKKAEQMSIKYKLSFADKQKADGEIVHTVHNLPAHKQMDLLQGATVEQQTPKDLKSGLIQTLTVGEANDSRVVRLPAQFVAAGDTVSDMIPADLAGQRFTSRWNGYIDIKERVNPKFALQGEGIAVLKIDGREVLFLIGEFDGKLSEAIQLDPGVHTFELSYIGLKSGHGKIRTLWQTGDIPLQSIPTSFFKYQQSEALSRALQRRAGRDVMAQQNCLKCHKVDENLTKKGFPLIPEHAEQGPNLSGIGSRVSEQWLSQWLANAHDLKPSTTMPMFVDVSTQQGRQDVADMAAYLASLKVQVEKKTDPVSVDDVKKGGDKFNRLGCIACHSLPSKSYDEASKRIPLNNVHQKFSQLSLEEFLNKPDRHHPSIKMPDFNFKGAEAREISAYLRDQSKGKQTKPLIIAVKGNSVRGKELIVKHDCSACHSGLPKSDSKLPKLSTILAKNWSNHGCASVETAGTHPKMNLSDEQKKQLETYRNHLLAHGGEKQALSGISLHDLADRQYKELNCASCHKRDGKASVLPRFTQQSAFLSEGMPVDERHKVDQTRPQMTYIGEMLHTDYMQKMLDGKVSSPRPWLGMRMPAFHSRAENLAKGLAAQHGMEPSKFVQGDIDPKKAEIGKKLIGSNGGFACIICHANGKNKALAAFEVEGINLDQVAQRLRPGYYHRWMENPQSIMPTKMPRYTMKNRSPMTDYNHDAKKQFEAIQEYLKSIHKEDAKK